VSIEAVDPPTLEAVREDGRSMRELEPAYRRSSGLVDVLDRVLDKGLVVAGDIRVSLAEVELLTIRIRLLVCSIDKAEQIGLDWWRHDPNLAVGTRVLAEENAALREEVRALAARVDRLAVPRPRARRRAPARRTARSVRE
jgi:gas vesicle protein GvpA/GvpJ/GvpM family